MSSGFVSAGKTLDFDDTNPKDTQDLKDAADDGPGSSEATHNPWAAANEKLQASRTNSDQAGSGIGGGSAADDGRSLFDILQANKARKQEEFEEKLKFKNQFRALDEDEIDFLDSIVSSERAAEDARKKELESKLDDFRRLQYDADHDSPALTDERAAEAAGAWAVGGRKRRKKDKEKEAGSAGSKLRKMSDGSRRDTEADTKSNPAISSIPPDDKHAEKDENAKEGNDKDASSDKGAKQPTSTSDSASATAEAKPSAGNEAKKPTGGGGLGLVAYGSDSESD